MDKKIVEQIKKILEKNQVTKAAVFGSFARGESKKDSDIDLVIKPPENFTLLDVIGLKNELEDSLKRDVDLITFDSMNKRIKASILREMKVVV
jgi:hypothetical protein